MPSLGASLKKASKREVKSKESVWKGPEVDGITQSLLSRFLCCRERFRLLVVEGLKPAPSFNHRLEFGQMWHICEEALASEKVHFKENQQGIMTTLIEDNLKKYCRGLCQKYRTQQEQIVHWMNVVKVAFPIYVDYWAKHQDVKDRTPLLQEQVFDVPYTLPSSRVVRLRGKWDSVDLIGRGKNSGVYLQENKTKGDINEEQLKRQLSSGFDLQTMLYLVALAYSEEIGSMPCRLAGVRYNVIRRPLSGGRGSIKQLKPTKGNPAGESSDEFYARLGEIIKEDPSYFFMRWKIEVSPQDIERFRDECLDPILEDLCDWWDRIQCSLRMSANPFTHKIRDDLGRHFRAPFGVYDVLKEGGSSDLDEFLQSGSELGLVRTDNLFTELV